MKTTKKSRKRTVPKTYWFGGWGFIGPGARADWKAHARDSYRAMGLTVPKEYR